MKSSIHRLRTTLALACTLGLSVAAAAPVSHAAPPAPAQAKADAKSGSAAAPSSALFVTHITKDDLDPETYTHWVDGKEEPRPNGLTDKEMRAFMPDNLVYTSNSQTSHGNYAFGDSKNPGPRHLRIGFHNPVAVGTVIVNGTGTVSALKKDAKYPGDLGNDSQWIPAQRLEDGAVSSQGANGLAVWVLPPGTETTALRLTHVAEAKDRKYNGNFGGMCILKERLANIAPQAMPIAMSNNQHAARLINEKSDGWGSWENASVEGAPARGQTVAEAPEWMMLVWPKAVSINGFAFTFTGFGTAEVQTYAGPDSTHPRDAADSAWKTVGTADKLESQYPRQLGLEFFDFGKAVSTRAVRLRITATNDSNHPHMKSRPAGGKRVWLGEWMVLSDLKAAPVATLAGISAPARPKKAEAPPIGIPITLPEDGFVTLVIEDSTGKRVRNLVSETPFPKGKSVVEWDGTDDLGRDLDAAKHGLYRIPAQVVAPGSYKVRGIWRKAIDPRYEFSVYVTGNPPWNTPDHTGAWLANHSAPQAAAFVPAAKSPTGEPVVFLGAYVTEGPDGFIWVDMNGKKVAGKKWIGGNWTAAPFIAADNGPQAIADHCVYVASTWKEKVKKGSKDVPVGELRITAQALNPNKLAEGTQRLVDTPIYRGPIPDIKGEGVAAEEDADPDHDVVAANARPDPTKISGLAVHNGLIAVSFVGQDGVALLNARDGGKQVGQITIKAPTGVAFDGKGRLLVLSGNRLVRYEPVGSDPGKIPAPATVIAAGLEEPIALTIDAATGNIYISDRGQSHQVKAFSADGKPFRTIGTAGAPKAGPYDRNHMNNPYGIAVDGTGRLWVTECDFLPKRISVWTASTGTLEKAFYGPAKYGGGGTLDPQDRNRYYYADEGKGAIAFKLDWENGTYEPEAIYIRRTPETMKMPFRSAAAETPLYHNGRRYFTNCYNDNPTGGSGTTVLYLEGKDGVARPVIIAGKAANWDLLKTDEMKPHLPEGLDFNAKNPKAGRAFFLWTDANGDEKMVPEELSWLPGVDSGGMTVMPDLSLCVARLDGKAVRFAPTGFTESGVPKYDLTKPEVRAEGVESSRSSGGNQMLMTDDGHTIVSLGMAPFSPYSLSGAKDGKATWSYPNPWPGLHASHHAARPDRPGQVIGATRLMGGLFTPRGSDAGPMWAINANMGNCYIFTADGLFVTTVFHDVRKAPVWGMPQAVRNMQVGNLSLHDENFWPTIAQTSDGKVYMTDGARSSLVRLDGLETVKRLPDSTITITADDLNKARVALMAREAERQAERGTGILKVALPSAAPVVDGKLEDWSKAAWVDIEKAGAGANFNSDARPYDVRAAVAVADGKLFAAWKTVDDEDLLRTNSGEIAEAPFKTGGALDIMIGTNPSAPADRKAAAPGDVRLLITRKPEGATAKDAKKQHYKTMAVLYRPVVPGTPAEKRVPFSSPWRTFHFDQVTDISDKVQVADDGKGAFEISVPLDILGLKPQPGARLRGDIGVLRGVPGQTTARVYWSNKGTAIVSDVPSEAELLPALWGDWEFDRP
ncbi:hypothetical protein DB346_07915 [Verrucomicrobia bacterium LW23]|nr:hypothetical protein DB346_07915 [Verrucomicrobia bacterium LW23]